MTVNMGWSMHVTFKVGALAVNRLPGNQFHRSFQNVNAAARAGGFEARAGLKIHFHFPCQSNNGSVVAYSRR
jgi:hypothetical protein